MIAGNNCTAVAVGEPAAGLPPFSENSSKEAKDRFVFSRKRSAKAPPPTPAHVGCILTVHATVRLWVIQSGFVYGFIL